MEFGKVSAQKITVAAVRLAAPALPVIADIWCILPLPQLIDRSGVPVWKCAVNREGMVVKQAVLIGLTSGVRSLRFCLLRGAVVLGMYAAETPSAGKINPGAWT